MFSPLALILLPLGYLFLWPLVDRALRGAPDGGGAAASPLQIALTALALSVGLLALAEFWLGVLPGRWLTPLAALGVALTGLALGLLLNPGWLAPRRWLAYWREQWRALTRLDLPALLTLAALGALAIILTHDLYYPFIGDDVLVRYGLQAKAIYAARRIPESVVGYPPLVPLGIASTWFAAGGPNEHLARALAAVMAAGALGATYLIGRQTSGRTGGLLAAALVALTPVFVNNATLLYTDIPTAFPLTLAFFYALRWWGTARPRDALLAGILSGIALLTKQSALLWLAGLAALPGLRLIARKRALPPLPGATSGRWERGLAGEGLRAWAAFLLPPLLIAGPWYARNALLGADVLPIAGLYHLLAPGAGLLGLVPPLADPRGFAGWLLTPVYAVGWVVGLVSAAGQLLHVFRAGLPSPKARAASRISAPSTPFRPAGTFPLPGGRPSAPPRRDAGTGDGGCPELLAALFVIPYWLAWWTTFSFDSRFLLLILPLMALWSVRPLLWLAGTVGGRARLPRRAWQALGGALLLGLLLWGARERLGGVYWAVTRPSAPPAERLARAKPELADLVGYAHAHLDPATDRLYLMDERLVYYLDGFDVAVGYPQTLAELEGYDYLFHSSGLYAVYGDGRLGWEDSEFYRHAFDPALFEPVYESGGVHIMRVLRADLSARAEEP